jgi:integrase
VPIGANPFGKRLIRIDDASKVLHKRRSLTLAQFHSLLKHRLLRAEPIRTMVISAICTGLRCSELFALRWSDFDWKNRTITVERGVVSGVFDRPKNQSSAGQLPLAAELAEVLWKWKLQSPYNGQTDFVFASPSQVGEAPCDPSNIQKRYLRPAGVDIGFADTLGWHTFRHTYRTLLDESHAPLSAQQELMRHAHPDTTLRYGEAITPTKRKANRKIVELVLPRKKARRA